ncbi:MAG: calcium-binding protein [Pleurocapsa sp.]
MAFKVGTPNEDTLSGGLYDFESDFLYGYGDDDVLNGYGGDDKLYGDRGPSGIHTGIAGDDTLRGGSGNDGLYGDGGNDWLSGGFDKDTMDGGVGYDTLHGGPGNDFLVGGQRGNHIEIDKLTGSSGVDTFAFGDFHGNLYSNGGNSDYGVVTDFDPSNEIVRLDLGNYSFGSSTFVGISGTAIYHDSELIGILEGVSRHSVMFEDTTFETHVKGSGLGFKFG